MLAHVKKLPEWFKSPLNVKSLKEMEHLLTGLHLHTICESGCCPNRHECFEKKTATFLILGNICTRTCKFCCVKKGSPAATDPAEPKHIVKAIEKLGLKYVVITSVSRDDLTDGGASHFKAVIDAVSAHDPAIKIEVLIPDFKGSDSALETVVNSKIDVLNHNIETIPRLYGKIRPEANYQRSVSLLGRAHKRRPELLLKSGIMLGLGETNQEIFQVMDALLNSGCKILTIGQYLQPSNDQHEVSKFFSPEEFKHFKEIGKNMGFDQVISGPKVRSSYHAYSAFENMAALNGKS